MWGWDHKDSWAPKNRCFWTVVLEKTLDSPLDCKEIQPVPPKGNQSWIILGRTDAEAEAPSDATHSLGKTLMLGKIKKAGGERDGRGWDGWIASLTQWTWVWASSGSWWWTGKTGVPQSMARRVRHDWVAEPNWAEWLVTLNSFSCTYLAICISSLGKCLFKSC